jgi:hypothetical protein
MPIIKINDKDYDTEKLTDAAKVPILHIQMIDAELIRLNAQIAIHRTARLAYERGLAEALKQMEEKPEGSASTAG